MFNHRYRYYFILVLAAYTYLNTELCEVYKYFKINIEWYYSFVTIAAITFCVWEGNRVIEPFFKKYIEREGNKIKGLITFFIVGAIVTSAAAAGIVFLVSMILHTHSFKETVVPLKLNLIYAGLVNLLFHLLNAIVFYFQEYKNKLTEAEELKRASAQSELQLIKSQINPHFLFNNLNVLSALVMQNNSEANRFIEEFSKVYRYILSNHNKELVELRAELDFINTYIFLLQKRFADGLKVTMNIPDNYKQHYIIPASLQMLIENAIKHNVVSKNKPLHIDVHINGNNTIVVSNNLQLKQTVENSTEIGLNNIMKRYLLVSGRKVVVDTNNDAFTVTLPLLHLN
jgi:two-component system, LytTR family, sensor kinase